VSAGVKMKGRPRGEVTEWPIVRHWKCRVGVKPHRGFESRPLRFLLKPLDLRPSGYKTPHVGTTVSSNFWRQPALLHSASEYSSHFEVSNVLDTRASIPVRSC